jgi:arylsulfatase A-like enzyme
MILGRTAAGLATGTIANAMHMLVCVADDRITTPKLFLFHWMVVCVFHVAAALLLAGRFKNRLWSAVLFLFPLAIVGASEAQGIWSDWGPLAALLGAISLGVAAVGLRRGAASPFWSALAGSAAASAIPYIHLAGYTQQIQRSWLLIAAVATLLIAAAVALFADRKASSDVPALGFSAKRFALFAAVGLAAFGFTPSVERMPAGAPEAKGGESRPSVVLIVLDTLRADHLELYGYERNTMPELTRFARTHGVIAQQAIANGPSSLPTHASLFTGLYPVHHGAHKPFLRDIDRGPVGYAYRLDPRARTLAEGLADAGYWTVGISANTGPLAPIFGLAQGFELYRSIPNPRRQFLRLTPWGVEEVTSRWVEKLLLAIGRAVPGARDYFLGVPYRRAAEITDEALRVLELGGTRPLFLFVNYMEAHSPYFPAEGFLDAFPGRSDDLLASGYDPRIADGEGLNAEEQAHYKALYDGELRYLDREVARLLTGLQQNPGWDETLVVITSDHGESLGDHGGLEHSNGLYDEITHVPLIVKPGRNTPGAPAMGSMLQAPIESVDVFATVLAHAGLAIPDGIDGRNWGADRQHGFAWLYPSPELPEEQRSVQQGSWKLIRSSTGKTQLFNRDLDPGESLDLSVAEQMRTEALGDVLDTIVPRRQRPKAEVPKLNRELIEQLRALGYLK